MSLCTCPDRPRCEMYRGSCGNYADGYGIVPAAVLTRPIRFTSRFACKACWEYFCEAWKKPIPGWDRPEWADDEWKPSVIACIEIVRINANERDRQERERKMRDGTLDREPDEIPMILQKGAAYSLEQMKQLKILSGAIRQTRRASAA